MSGPQVNVSAAQIQAAGGLDKWMARHGRDLQGAGLTVTGLAHERGAKRAVRPPSPSGLPTEEEEQEALFAWSRSPEARIEYPELACLYAIPNGGKRPPKTAAKMRATGQEPGVPDACLALPIFSAGCAGLYIELKRCAGGVISEEQWTWIRRLTAAGYRVEVCAGADQARAVIVAHINQRRREDLQHAST